VCELGRAGRYRRLVQYSSSEVYGTARTTLMAEDHEIRPHTPYAAAKAATDMVAESYGLTFGQEMVLVRPFNTYGERQNSGSYAGLIPAVVTRVRAGEPVHIHGDGHQSRDLTYVGDQVQGVLAAVQCDEALARWINLGSGQEATVNELVALILEAMGAPDHPIEHVPQRIGDVRRHQADIGLARRLFGYGPPTRLAEGIERTVNWYAQTLG
jgi:UDP-glucose 4-epimerase